LFFSLHKPKLLKQSFKHKLPLLISFLWIVKTIVYFSSLGIAINQLYKDDYLQDSDANKVKDTFRAVSIITAIALCGIPSLIKVLMYRSRAQLTSILDSTTALLLKLTPSHKPSFELFFKAMNKKFRNLTILYFLGISLVYGIYLISCVKKDRPMNEIVFDFMGMFSWLFFSYSLFFIEYIVSMFVLICDSLCQSLEGTPGLYCHYQSDVIQLLHHYDCLENIVESFNEFSSTRMALEISFLSVQSITFGYYVTRFFATATVIDFLSTTIGNILPVIINVYTFWRICTRSCFVNKTQ